MGGQERALLLSWMSDGCNIDLVKETTRRIGVGSRLRGKINFEEGRVTSHGHTRGGTHRSGGTGADRCQEP